MEQWAVANHTKVWVQKEVKFSLVRYAERGCFITIDLVVRRFSFIVSNWIFCCWNCSFQRFSASFHWAALGPVIVTIFLNCHSTCRSSVAEYYWKHRQTQWTQMWFLVHHYNNRLSFQCTVLCVYIFCSISRYWLFMYLVLTVWRRYE